MAENYLKSKTFFSIMGILLVILMAVIGYLVVRVDSTNEKFNHNFTQVTNSISGIQTDISWIKDNLK